MIFLQKSFPGGGRCGSSLDPHMWGRAGSWGKGIVWWDRVPLSKALPGNGHAQAGVALACNIKLVDGRILPTAGEPDFTPDKGS